MGKTSLALPMLRNAALDYKIGVGMFSLEMSNSQLAMGNSSQQKSSKKRLLPLLK